jgi:putative spermidine/putrescine transport system ATP-binding protein
MARTMSATPDGVQARAPDKLATLALTKRYRDTVALHPIDLSVAAGEFVTVLGASGSGKTTLLQLICGLAEPTGGRLLIDGVDRTHTPARERRMGVVFQNYALFPHMTVEENTAFALDVRRIAGAELRRRVENVLEMVGLASLAKRFPRELSGGQQQRVALARCFVFEPSVILMDEPLGALDRKLRETLQIEIKRLHRQTGATILFVTHDQEEALALSDRICLLHAGRVEQIATPAEIYERPRTLLAAEFIGLSNLLRGTVGPGGDVLTTQDGPVALSEVAAPGQAAALVVRPEHTVIGLAGATLSGTVIETTYAGSETRVMVALPSGSVFTVRRPPLQPNPALGETVTLGWSPDHAHILPL